LRKNVKFHSGDTFTAKDVKYTFDTAKASDENDDTEAVEQWVSKSVASRVDTITVVEDYTLELKTAKSEATLMSLLVYLGIVSQAQVEKDGLAKAVGTGPYKFVSVDENSAVFDANTDYWGGAPKVKKVTYLVEADVDEAKKDLQSGAIDVAILPGASTTGLTAAGFQESLIRLGDITMLAFDVNSAKSKYVDEAKNPFADVKVREAVLLALDIPKIITASTKLS
jgi:ABC-type transport system substrate-binding protein